MPNDPNIQIIIAVVVALIIIAAIVWGKRRVRIKAGGMEASVEDQERRIVVAEGLDLKDARVRNVVGSRTTGDRAPATEISVFNHGKVEGGEVGDIIGEESVPGNPAQQPAGTPKKCE
jgi:hypothetical protein